MPKRLAALDALAAQDGRVLTEGQVAALERTQPEKTVHGEFERECPGSSGAQDTDSVGTIQGVGRIYQQTFLDLDRFVDDDNPRWPHQGRWCDGKTPMQTFLDTLPLALEKLIPSEERVSTPPH